jgi:hypothetical protein
MFELSFLNSSALIISLASLVPLIIYLIARKKPPRIIFSSIRFIQLTQKQQKKKVNIKNILLLIIRMLVILLVVLAISRPAVKLATPSGSSNHPRTAVALVLDNSYSMDYVVDTQTELDRGIALADEIREMLTSDDISILYTLDKSWNDHNSTLEYGSFSEDKLHSVELTPKALSLGEVIRLAESSLIESQIPNREIYFISDMQEQEFPEKLETTLFLIPTSNIRERRNLSIENAFLSSSFVERGIEKQIGFEVVNNSRSNMNDVICSLTLDGTTVAERVTDLMAGQRQQGSFIISLERPGWHSGYVSVRDERLVYDNRYNFAFYYNHQPKTGIITSENKLPRTLRTILTIYNGGDENIRLISDNISLENLAGFDNLIVWRYDDWGGQLQFVLSNLASRGQNILFLSDPGLDERARGYLSDEFELEFYHLQPEGEELKITGVNKYHPVAMRLDDRRKSSLRDIWLGTSASNLILEAEGYPVVLENNGNILWLFDINDLRSSFLVDANYPILANNSLMYTASSGMGRRQFVSGMLHKPEDDLLVLPDGSRLQTGSRKLSLIEPGIYKEGIEEIPLAVNLDYSESRFSEISVPESDFLIRCDEGWRSVIFQARYGFELWKYLVLAALALMALEMYIVKSEERRA